MIAEENYGFPPTYRFILKKIMPSGRLKVLDLGCGKGVAAEILNPKRKHQFTGIDIYKPYLKICQKKGYYKSLKKINIEKIILPKNSFDVVLLLQVIEHLDKKTAKKILTRASKAAKNCVIVSVPNGYCLQEEYDCNIHNKHLSFWTVSDLRNLGFTVYGQGLKIIYGSDSYGAGKNAVWWQKIVVPLTVILLPIIMIYPQIGAQLIGVKYSDQRLIK